MSIFKRQRPSGGRRRVDLVPAALVALVLIGVLIEFIRALL